MSGGLYGNGSAVPADASALPMRWRVLRATATLAALAVLMLVIADTGWRWLAPAPKAPPVVARDNDSPAATINTTPWFGARATTNSDASVAPAANDGLSGDARLLGIIAGRDGNGYALFRFPDRGPVLIATGQEIAPGVSLRAITDSGIRVSDRGEARDIALRPSAASAASKATNAASPQVAARTGNAAACTPPGGGGGPVYRLNAELLTGIAAKPDSWSNAFTAGSDGLIVREGNAFGAMLGMRAGDRVTQANGIALRGTQDVLVAVIRPLLASQAVRIGGVRDGQPTQWIFVNASACPA